MLKSLRKLIKTSEAFCKSWNGWSSFHSDFFIVQEKFLRSWLYSAEVSVIFSHKSLLRTDFDLAHESFLDLF